MNNDEPKIAFEVAIAVTLACIMGVVLYGFLEGF